MYAGFSLLLIFLLLSFLVSAGMLHHLNERLNRLVAYDMEKIRLIGLLDRSILEIARAERNIILSDKPEEMRLHATDIAQAGFGIRSALEKLDGLTSRASEKAVLAQITKAIGELMVIVQEVQRLGMLNSNVRALQLSESAGRESMRLAEQALEQLFTHDREQRALLVREMQRLLMTIQKDEILMILTIDETGMARHARAMEENEAILARHYDVLASLLLLQPELEILHAFDRHLRSYLEISRQVRALTWENGNHKAIRLSQEQGNPVVMRLRDLMRILSADGEQHILETKREAEQERRLAVALLSVMLCLSFVVGVFIALRISRDVNRGLSLAIRTVEAVARGDSEAESLISLEERHDEFGQLMRAMRCLENTESCVPEMAHGQPQEDCFATLEERSASDRLLAAMKHLALALRERAELRRMLLISEKMSSIGQFAVRVAHEINNPLSTAAMGLQNVRLLLSGRIQDEAVLSRLDQVERNLERVTRVARQMLEYSWTGQMECVWFHLREELMEVLELVQADQRPVEIVLEMEEPLRMWGDRTKIGQVLRNLIQNALDATPDPGVIRVNARCAGEMLVLHVRDWGPGLAPHVEGKIFEPFFTTKQFGIGVGLGLPICYSIVQQHGGMLEVVNAPDGGVLATLHLPLFPPRYNNTKGV
ncbi:MAG: MCP four helix bundle domain-containing protein [Magnetococcus sp. YQC-5]